MLRINFGITRTHSYLVMRVTRASVVAMRSLPVEPRNDNGNVIAPACGVRRLDQAFSYFARPHGHPKHPGNFMLVHHVCQTICTQ
jgi:hypothetical protein